MTEQALSDVRVLDLTWYIAGPYCTKLLADYGADVIKVERPGRGDPARMMGPFQGDDPHPEKSGLFLHLNTNKKSITLNPKSPTGKRIFLELVKQADILVESFSPRVMPSLGLSYEELEKVNPRMVMTSVSNFGQTGPYRDYKATDMIIFGMGGPMYFTGLPEREPLKIAGTVVLYQVGNIAAVATMMALQGSELRGTGEHVDVSAFETQAGTFDRRCADLLAFQYTGDVSVRAPAISADYPSGTFPCKDGYFDITGGGMNFFPRTCHMIGMPELANDPRFRTAEDRANPVRREEFLSQYFLPWVMQHSKRDIAAIGQAARVPTCPVFTTEDLLNDPHFEQRGFFVDITHPVTEKLKYPGAPFRMSHNPWVIRRPAPLLGQHNEEVYSALGLTRGDLAKLKEQGII